jgi:riboflavin kinase/FMN adenylyltransferase
MKTHFGLKTLGVFRNTTITVGTFDGVHLGHLSVIDHLKSVAEKTGGESIVVTFDVPPRTVTMPWAKNPGILTTLEEKTERLEKSGISHLIIIPFTLSFSKLSPEAFIRDILITQAGMKAIVPGYDHIFGHGGSGGVGVLMDLGDRYGFTVEQSPEFRKDGTIVSSSIIRTLVSDGKIEEANMLLGYPYNIKGKVVYGKQLGRTIGFPTINVEKENAMKITPGNGVYAVEVVVGGERGAGNGERVAGSGERGAGSGRLGDLRYRGMCNIGIRPTVNGVGLTTEVNIFDFNEDVYGEEVRVYFRKKIRDERRFSGLEELQGQLAKDREVIRQIVF